MIDSITINEKALKSLIQQDWNDAQNLFRENARKNPSHETYNNWGIYLIDEGIVCKNGKFKSARKLGLKYLKKAAMLKESQVNMCAIVKASNIEMRFADDMQRQQLLEQSKDLLEQALKIKYVKEIHYNYLRVLYLLGIKTENVLEQVRILITHYVREESISLYFALLLENSLVNEGLQCIKKYGKYIANIELLLFFVKFELYEQGYCFCESVKLEFEPDIYVMAAIIECYLKTGHNELVENYVQYLKDYGYVTTDNSGICKDTVLNDILESEKNRKNLLSKYKMMIPYIEVCSYYGCPVHGTEWPMENESNNL